MLRLALELVQGLELALVSPERLAHAMMYLPEPALRTSARSAAFGLAPVPALESMPGQVFSQWHPP